MVLTSLLTTVTLMFIFNCFLFLFLVKTSNQSPINPARPPDCPDKCQCLPATDILADGPEGWQIVCVAIGLSTVPDYNKVQLPRPAYTLDFDYNNITSLQVFENVSELRYLDVSYNRIDSIEPRSFSALPNLSILNLSNNRLSSLPSNLFENLDHLMVLDLSGNKFTYLPTDLFSPLLSLTILNAGKNFLRHLELGLFDKNLRLDVLDLSENQLTSIPVNLLTNNMILKTLDLSGNAFDTVPSEALQGIPSLEALSIDGNPIRVLNHRSFPHLPNLANLSIQRMPFLKTIEEVTFSYLCSLQKIDISQNQKLISIDPDAFLDMHQSPNCSNLKKVNLRNNKLTKLPQLALPWCSLETVDLTGNPWQCDCDLRWLRECQHLLKPGLRCNQPKELNERDFIDIDVEQFTCDGDFAYETRIQRFLIMIIAMIAFFVSGMIIALFIQRPMLMDWVYGRKKGIGSIYYVKAPILMTEY